MCLILVALRVHPDFPLIVAANRDEFHARASEPAGSWKDQPAILAGRDLQAGGTWLGVSRSGRFASVTNYRGGRDPNALESRGALVARFLEGTLSARQHVADLDKRGSTYSGFALLDESMAAIELDRVRLREQLDLRVAPLARDADQPLQDRCADALAAPFLQHGHAADVAVGQQAPGGDRRVCSAIGERMDALLV